MKKLLFLCNSYHLYIDIMPIIQEMSGMYATIYAVGSDFTQTHTLIKQIRPDAIIAPPITTEFIKPYVNCPVISLVPSQLDILTSLNIACGNTTEDIYFIGYSHRTLKADKAQFEQMLRRKIHIITYDSVEERQILLQSLPLSAIHHAVVTSSLVKDHLASLGIDVVLLRWSASSVLLSITTAYDVITSVEKEEQRNEWLTQVLDNVQDGIIGINNNTITEFNASSSNIFGVSPSSLLGQNIDQLSEKSSLYKLLKLLARSSEKEFLHDIKGKLYLVGEITVTEQQRLIFLKDKSEINRLQANFLREAERRGLTAKYEFSDIIGSCASIQRSIKLAQRYAESDATILILGDTGTGKELFAQSIHNASLRSDGPFVAVNCAAVPENILESELFGYEGGSFTGARKEGKLGLFELANSGTLFLDEIGEMPLLLQARILRVLQSKEIMHLGGSAMIPVDVRIIAATNRDLEQAIQQKEFRKDLYYRLSILTLNIPPLEKRREDIPALVAYFHQQKEKKYHKEVPPLSAKAIEVLCEMDWPGNVRELEGLIERYVILDDERIIYGSKDLLTRTDAPGSAEAPKYINLRVGALRLMEQDILQTLSDYYTDIEMSQVLQISRSTIWRKLRDSKIGSV